MTRIDRNCMGCGKPLKYVPGEGSILLQRLHKKRCKECAKSLTKMLIEMAECKNALGAV